MQISQMVKKELQQTILTLDVNNVYRTFTILITGCYTIRVFHNSDMLREKHDGEMHGVSMPFIDSQILGQSKVRSACPSGASMVLIEQTLTDGLVHYFSLGFYSSYTIKIWCKRRIR